MESAREARRRKIMERSSDRLAFITGNLDPSSLTSSRPPTLQQEQVEEEEEEDPRSTTTAVRHHDGATGMEAHKHQPVDQTFGTAILEDDKTELHADRQLSRLETSSEFAKCKMGKRFQKVGIRKEAAASAERDVKIVSSDQVVDTTPSLSLPINYQILTFKQISLAISTSENIRLLCAVVIALLVALSARGHSLGDRIKGSITNFRPLLLVLLTDAAVIIGIWLLVSVKGPGKDGGEASRTRREEFGSANNNIGNNALEIGLVFQKALNAALMDCSICAVILISGLFG